VGMVDWWWWSESSMKQYLWTPQACNASRFHGIYTQDASVDVRDGGNAI
jgi:hypothetical protein